MEAIGSEMAYGGYLHSEKVIGGSVSPFEIHSSKSLVWMISMKITMSCTHFVKISIWWTSTFGTRKLGSTMASQKPWSYQHQYLNWLISRTTASNQQGHGLGPSIVPISLPFCLWCVIWNSPICATNITWGGLCTNLVKSCEIKPTYHHFPSWKWLLFSCRLYRTSMM